ncbi:MAG: DNA polymerase III subunit delta' [Burkholderiales bacterium PBB5]|nr:MAG: DNA polymerase III subunit delta' [Burkholderiales bacterium PBB5]
MPIGVLADGRLPLPWLDGPLQRADALVNSHALLLCGPAGAGHLELALLLAQGQLCEARAPGAGLRPCGRCASCHLVRGRSHPDLLLVLPEALRVQLGWVGDDEGRLTKADAKPSKDLKVEQLRQAIAWTQQTSGRGQGKVLLLHPADALNITSANALLKTLEEPPGGLRILLTSTDPERLLPTVRSRCQRLALGLPPPDQAAAWLRQQGLADDDAAALLAATSDSPLEALTWAAEGWSAELLATLPARVAGGDATLLSGRALPRVIDLLLKIAHDGLARAVGGAARFFPQARWPAGADLAALVAWQKALLRAARHDEHPWNAGLLLESLVIQAAACWPAAQAAGVQRSGQGASLHSAR